MTDDPNAEPNPNVEPKPEPEPNVLRGAERPEEDGEGATEGGEAAQDLDETQLEAAAEGAEDEVSDEGDEAAEEAEAAEAAEDTEAAEDETGVLEAGAVAAPIGTPGARRPEPEARGPRERGPKTTRTAFAIDPALRIHDRASAAFVILTVVVFGLILANALLFGSGGALTPIASPSPTQQASEAPSESPSGAPSASPAPTIAPSPAPSASPAGSTAPSTGPSTAPSPS